MRRVPGRVITLVLAAGMAGACVPGVLMPGDAAVDEFGTVPAICAATGSERCGPVVRFTFPSATPVELPLQ